MSDSTNGMKLDLLGADTRSFDFPPPALPERIPLLDAYVLLQSLHKAVTNWRRELPSDAQPAILAILHGGRQLQVERLSNEGYEHIRIEGRFEASDPPCFVVAHKATVQLLCYVQTITPERPPRDVVFVINGKALLTPARVQVETEAEEVAPALHAG